MAILAVALMTIVIVIGIGASLRGHYPNIGNPQSASLIVPTQPKAETASPQIFASKPPRVETQQSCLSMAETKANRAWIRACYLQGLLTPQCLKVFSEDGGYLPADTLPSDTVLEHYIDDVATCACRLPMELAKQLNDNAAFQNNLCKSSYPN